MMMMMMMGTFLLARSLSPLNLRCKMPCVSHDPDAKDVNSLSSPSFHSMSTYMPAPASHDDSPDDEEDDLTWCLKLWVFICRMSVWKWLI